MRRQSRHPTESLRPSPRARRPTPRKGEGDTQASAPRAAHVIDTSIIRLGAHDRQRLTTTPLPTTTTSTRSGRPQNRARIILPEGISGLTGLVPGAAAGAWVTADGTLHLQPLPGQDHLHLAWEAEQLLARKEAADRQAWAIQTALDLRLPYDQVGPNSRKKRRRIEARRGIPRDWPRDH